MSDEADWNGSGSDECQPLACIFCTDKQFGDLLFTTDTRLLHLSIASDTDTAAALCFEHGDCFYFDLSKLCGADSNFSKISSSLKSLFRPTQRRRLHAVLDRKTFAFQDFWAEGTRNSHFAAIKPISKLYKIISICIKKKPDWTNSGLT